MSIGRRRRRSTHKDYLVDPRPPKVRGPEDIRKLPWTGCAAGDVPLILHVERYARNDKYRKDKRQKSMELAGFLMTGENCDFTPDYTFDDWLANLEPV